MDVTSDAPGIKGFEERVQARKLFVNDSSQIRSGTGRRHCGFVVFGMGDTVAMATVQSCFAMSSKPMTAA